LVKKGAGISAALVCVMNWQVLFENCSVAVFIPFADAFHGETC